MDFPPENVEHPELCYKGLVYVPEGEEPPEGFEESRRGLDIENYDYENDENHELCWFCGWTSYNQRTSNYGPRIRFLQDRANTGMWALGSQLLLKDIPNDGHSPGSDFVTQQFLRNQPGLSIPLLKRMELLNEPGDKTYLLLMSRSKGIPLEAMWHTLSDEKKNDLREQMFIYLRELRQFTSPIAQTVDGRLIDDCIIGACGRSRPNCKQIGNTTEEWLESVKEELLVGLSKVHETTDAIVIEKEFQKLKDNFPDSEPYILTHGDLTLGNIMVDPEHNKITEIIDWEYAGYYPWWAEVWLNGNLAQDGSIELLEPLWERLSPDMETQRYRDLVSCKLAPVLRAWERCRLQHPGSWTFWYRPAFSKCEPYAGKFHMASMGRGEKKPHVILAEQYD
ncbi:Protein kinase-like (PK-like) [Glarea lozoyensis ATCC 20868]|uniref:Protein kinase-like (PK-like) n=1 Tax=Glarea lozoyensis (strain ATCC 20868 / MF5171) TaxID=1116229 RepID=S3DB03_GLAL2|nr:Protein kinase-like (PK-like) [Glarea lozoyensis ATCC 20868]EPE35657.1 Protein kinase-like (PK-like) [Glarea lozoyensis ATCC 20868]